MAQGLLFLQQQRCPPPLRARLVGESQGNAADRRESHPPRVPTSRAAFFFRRKASDVLRFRARDRSRPIAESLEQGTKFDSVPIIVRYPSLQHLSECNDAK